MASELEVKKALQAPGLGKLFVPDGRILGYSPGIGQPLTKEDLDAYVAEFEAKQRNLETFHAMVSEGLTLSRVGGLTSYTDFMAQSLGSLQKEATWRNKFTELLHSHDTKINTTAMFLPWASVFMDYFSRTPIPQNIAAIENGNRSLKALAGIVESDEDFYENMQEGVKVAELSDGASFKMPGIDDLVFTIMGGDRAMVPQQVSAESSTIEVDGRVFYNGLPGDRARFPSILYPEGAQVALQVRNESENKVYLVMPTINGIPFKIDQLGFKYDKFAGSALPVDFIKPVLSYIKPNESEDFDQFFVNRSEIIRDGMSDTFMNEIDREKEIELAYILGRIFDSNMSPETGSLLAGCSNSYVKDKILLESRLRHVSELQKHLNEARSSEIYMSRPEMADGKASSELDNPFLGSIGIMVMEVTAPPVESRHEFGSTYLLGGGDRYLTMGGGMKGSIGSAGLGHISVGRDRAAEKIDFWSQYKFDDAIHRFKGYMPLNILSLRE